MFDETGSNAAQGRNEGSADNAATYLAAAERARRSGDGKLGMHLYLAAFERAVEEAGEPSEPVIDGLRQAWKLACALKERSMAEYIFEKLEPFLSLAEAPCFAAELQQLALDKLEEFGLSRDDLEDMADALSQDILDDGASFVHVEGLSLPFEPWGQGASLGQGRALAQGLVGDDALEALESFEPVVDDSAADAEDGAQEPAPGAQDLAESSGAEKRGGAREGSRASGAGADDLSFANLAGYRRAIERMRAFGIGRKDDEDYQRFLRMLNERHGIDRTPASGALVFASEALEDADRFVSAVVGEVGLPAVRMSMEEGAQGAAVLCVSAKPDARLRLSNLRRGLDVPSVLVLEGLDSWERPEGADDDPTGFMEASLSHGVQEIVDFVRHAVDSPDVHVLATASSIEGIDPFFLDMLDPFEALAIELPDDEERAEIWAEIAREHPSLSDVDERELVRLSAGLARFDIYMAAREAVGWAYRASLRRGRYVPVDAANVFEKLAGYQPLDSDEYRFLEDAVVEGFKHDLDRLEDLLADSGGE